MTPFLARLWILIATVLVGAGWILSAIHGLNRAGYAVVLLITMLAVAAACRSWLGGASHQRRYWPRWRRRFTRGFPGAFLIIGALIALGACLYDPSNYDALSYRIPRTLNWLAAEQWHWIHTNSHRLNVRTAASEWLMAPGLLFFHSERIVVVQNLMMFALLPGLIFSVYRRAGVSPRVAWLAMWLVPTGYVFVTQAGGSANDVGGAFFALAAVDLALRARVTRSLGDLALSLCAVALLSSVKMNNAPLALAWLAVVLPAWRLALVRPLATVAVALAAGLVSFLPTAVLNGRFCGDWTGAKIELPNSVAASHGVIITANTLGLVAQNLAPPIFPWAHRWTQATEHWFPAKYNAAVRDAYGTNWVPLSMDEIQYEDGAGLGCGLTVLFGVTAVGAIAKRRTVPKVASDWSLRMLRWAPWVGLGIVLAKLGVTTEARLAAGYYPLLILGVLANPAARTLSGRAWWRSLAWLQVGSAILLVVANPPRPLWPALTVLTPLAEAHPGSVILSRAQSAFAVYRERGDGLAPVRALLPPGVENFGLIAHNETEASLWRPFGTRRFQYITDTDTRADLAARGIDYVVIHEGTAAHVVGSSVEEWMRWVDAEDVAAVSVATSTSTGPVLWRLVHLREPSGTTAPPTRD